MLTPAQTQNRIDDKIVVDYYGDYEVSAGWYETMNDRLNFPFEARAAAARRSASR